MTLEQWSIVQNSILLVLFILYGLWQKHIKDDLFKSKDTAIQTLEAIIKAKDAQISALQADTAPVIAQAYNTLKKYVREVTAESQLHAEQIKQTSKELTDVRDELDKERRTSGVQIKWAIRTSPRTYVRP